MRTQQGDTQAAQPIGPVRMPGDQERRAAILAVPEVRQMLALGHACTHPGRSLTQRGILRIAEARALVTAVGTGDDTTGARSAADLPHLDRLVNGALAAGIVRRTEGRLVAAGEPDEVAVHEQIVRAALVPAGEEIPAAAGADKWDALVLASLLDAGADGFPVAHLESVITRFVTTLLGDAGTQLRDHGVAWVHARLDTLAHLGVLTRIDDGRRAALTVAGVPLAVDVVQAAEIPVLLLPDPVNATAAQLADLVMEVDLKEWRAEAEAWFAARADPAEAATELVGALTGDDRSFVAVNVGLSVVADVLGEHALPAVSARADSTHSGLVLMWLLGHGGLDPESVPPERMLLCWVDVLAANLDLTGPHTTVAGLAEERAALTGMLEDVWRLDHPRIPDVLAAIGAHHPDKAVAKAARKAAMKHRSR